MKYLRADEVPAAHGDTVFREARWGKLVAFVIFLALTVGAFAVGFFPERVPTGDEIPRFVAFGSGAVFGIISMITLHSLRATLRPSNWLVRFDGRGLYLKFRSYLNHHFPSEDRVVVYVPGDEIEWIRRVGEKMEVPHERRKHITERSTYLEIGLKDGVPDTELAELLKHERLAEAPRVRRTRTKSQHYPVRRPEPGRIRVLWNSARTTVVPKIDRALAVLGRTLPVERPEREEHDQVTRDSSPEQQKRRIRELAGRGDEIAAVKLVQRLYDYSTTEAKEYVEKLLEARE